MPKKPAQPPSRGVVARVDQIVRRIYILRGEKVMIDSDLAVLYGVKTFRLNEAVKRNRKRFPKDFMFQLTAAESRVLTSQNAISKDGRGGRRTRPYVFTEHGVAMLSSALKSERAIQMNIQIIRAFVKMRELLATHKELAARVGKLELLQDRNSSVLDILIQEISDMKQLPPPVRRRIGFTEQQSAVSRPQATARRLPSARAH